MLQILRTVLQLHRTHDVMGYMCWLWRSRYNAPAIRDTVISRCLRSDAWWSTQFAWKSYCERCTLTAAAAAGIDCSVAIAMRRLQASYNRHSRANIRTDKGFINSPRNYFRRLTISGTACVRENGLSGVYSWRSVVRPLSEVDILQLKWLQY